MRLSVLAWAGAANFSPGCGARPWGMKCSAKPGTSFKFGACLAHSRAMVGDTKVAVRGIANCRLEKIGKRQLAEALRQRHPGGDRARNRDRVPALGRHRGPVLEAVERPALRRSAGSIQPVEL